MGISFGNHAILIRRRRKEHYHVETRDQASRQAAELTAGDWEQIDMNTDRHGYRQTWIQIDLDTDRQGYRQTWIQIDMNTDRHEWTNRQACKRTSTRRQTKNSRGNGWRMKG